jgi:hypothetical protein
MATASSLWFDPHCPSALVALQSLSLTSWQEVRFDTVPMVFYSTPLVLTAPFITTRRQ